MTVREVVLPKGITNTYAELQLGDKVSRSPTIWGERAPIFNKKQRYAVTPEDVLQLRLFELKKKGKPPKLVALAELRVADLTANGEQTVRLELQPGKEGSAKDKEAAATIEYHLLVRRLLAESAYDDFLAVLMEPKFTVCALLERMVDETGAGALAYPLVHVLTHHSKMHLYLENWINRELSRSEDTAVLFRGDSLGIKSFDVFLSWIGHQYLVATLGPHVERVVREVLPCELQEAKLEKTDRLRENFQNFLNEATKLTSSIFNSDYEAPAEFCYLFGYLTQLVMEKFPYKLEVSVIAINGFLFLRFFVPAIISPTLHGLWEGDIPQRANSTLNLLARVIQKLANMNLFDREREPHLHLLNDFLRAQQKEISLFVGKLAERKIRKETLAKVHRVPDPTLDITNEVASLVDVVQQNLPWWEKHAAVPEVAQLLAAVRRLRERTVALQ